MPALGAGIHVFLCFKTWMAGTSPAMTPLKGQPRKSQMTDSERSNINKS
ncbi:MAG TPA: hypothetical protein VMV79_03430 [Alphaproteobacteria bacterium]|nr:hypothetical protein [Alphaproteobacteria bacterium]